MAYQSSPWGSILFYILRFAVRNIYELSIPRGSHQEQPEVRLVSDVEGRAQEDDLRDVQRDAADRGAVHLTELTLEELGAIRQVCSPTYSILSQPCCNSHRSK